MKALARPTVCECLEVQIVHSDTALTWCFVYVFRLGSVEERMLELAAQKLRLDQLVMWTLTGDGCLNKSYFHDACQLSGVKTNCEYTR